MAGVLRQPLLLDEQLQGFKTPASGLDAVAAGLGAGLVEDGTDAQGLQEAAPRNAVGEALDRDCGPDAADIALASFEAVERNGNGSREAELGASHEGLRGSGLDVEDRSGRGMRPHSILSSLHPVPAPPLPLLLFQAFTTTVRWRFPSPARRDRWSRPWRDSRRGSDGGRPLADAVGWNRIFGLKRARSRIGRRAIEIDDRVEEAARPDEGVQRFAVFLSRPELWTAARRCERCADDPDGGRRRSQRPDAGCDRLLELLQARFAMRPEIVDALEPDDGRDAGEAENVAVEALQGSGAARVRVFSADRDRVSGSGCRRCPHSRRRPCRRSGHAGGGRAHRASGPGHSSSRPCRR